MRFHTAYGLDISQLDIVVIDDNEHSLAIFETILKAFRVARVRAFTSTPEALEDMKKEPPNLLITDWLKHSDDGCRLVQEIRHADMAPLCFMPILMITAHSSNGHEAKALKAGVNEFISKPVSPTTMYQRLGTMVQDRRRLICKNDVYMVEKNEEKARTIGIASAQKQRAAF